MSTRQGSAAQPQERRAERQRRLGRTAKSLTAFRVQTTMAPCCPARIGAYSWLESRDNMCATQPDGLSDAGTTSTVLSRCAKTVQGAHREQVSTRSFHTFI